MSTSVRLLSVKPGLLGLRDSFFIVYAVCYWTQSYAVSVTTRAQGAERLPLGWGHGGTGACSAWVHARVCFTRQGHEDDSLAIFPVQAELSRRRHERVCWPHVLPWGCSFPMRNSPLSWSMSPQVRQRVSGAWSVSWCRADPMRGSVFLALFCYFAVGFITLSALVLVKYIIKFLVLFGGFCGSS